MRMQFLVGAVAALALAATAASAQGMPGGVKMANGAMADTAGKALYTYDNDTMKGMSHCTGRCATAWPPLLAAADAKPSGDWSLVTREDGAKQWAYKDKPLYTFARDEAGKAGTGETVAGWKLAK